MNSDQPYYDPQNSGADHVEHAELSTRVTGALFCKRVVPIPPLSPEQDHDGRMTFMLLTVKGAVEAGMVQVIVQ